MLAQDLHADFTCREFDHRARPFSWITRIDNLHGGAMGVVSDDESPLSGSRPVHGQRTRIAVPRKSVERNHPDREVLYEGQPYLVDEFGGIKWVPPGVEPYMNTSWGYGEGPKNEEEFYQRLDGQVKAIRGLNHISGYCYTQLTDVEQEQNGIYQADRSEKFDMERVRGILSQ